MSSTKTSNYPCKSTRRGPSKTRIALEYSDGTLCICYPAMLITVLLLQLAVAAVPALLFKDPVYTAGPLPSNELNSIVSAVADPASLAQLISCLFGRTILQVGQINSEFEKVHKTSITAFLSESRTIGSGLYSKSEVIEVIRWIVTDLNSSRAFVLRGLVVGARNSANTLQDRNVGVVDVMLGLELKDVMSVAKIYTTNYSERMESTLVEKISDIRTRTFILSLIGTPKLRHDDDAFEQIAIDEVSLEANGNSRNYLIDYTTTRSYLHIMAVLEFYMIKKGESIYKEVSDGVKVMNQIAPNSLIAFQDAPMYLAYRIRECLANKKVDVLMRILALNRERINDVKTDYTTAFKGDLYADIAHGLTGLFQQMALGLVGSGPGTIFQ